MRRHLLLRAQRGPDQVARNEHGDPIMTCVRCGVRQSGRTPPAGASYVCKDCKGSDPYFYRQARSG